MHASERTCQKIQRHPSARGGDVQLCLQAVNRNPLQTRQLCKSKKNGGKMCRASKSFYSGVTTLQVNGKAKSASVSECA